MFSNLYYLSVLIDKSLSFSLEEKQKIFIYAKNNDFEILRLIKLFEDEQKGIDFIKTDYKWSLEKIWKNLKKDLENAKIEKQNKHIEEIRDKFKSIKKLELEEKEQDAKNLDLLINNI